MDINKILNPKTVSVLGVSLTNPFNPANVIYHKNNLRYQAECFAVNPSGGKLFGETLYQHIQEVPKPSDLVVLSIRAEFVPQAIRECIDAKTGGAVIVSGGFSEIGRNDLQDQVQQLSQEYAYPVIGPNCLGIFSPPAIDTFFLPHERLVPPRPGNVALLSQSGGILVDNMIKLTQEGVGLSRAVSIGNKVNIDEVDLIAFLRDDPKTAVIGLYLEGFSPGRGRTFAQLACEMEKPIVIFKSGKTPGGSRAVSSHTSAMAGDYRVFSEIMEQSHVFEAKNDAEFVAYCEALACCATSRIQNVCIITASGGHGAIASDGCFDSGLQLPEVPQEHVSELRKRLAPSIQSIASLQNPVDLTGSAADGDFLTATRFFLDKDYVDCILLLLLPYLPAITTDIGARIAQICKEFSKPVIAYLPHVEKYGIFIEGFEGNGLPVSHSVEGAVHMARALAKRGAI